MPRVADSLASAPDHTGCLPCCEVMVNLEICDGGQGEGGGEGGRDPFTRIGRLKSYEATFRRPE